MPSTRDIRRRIKSVKNTRQITKAMELVAASKMKRAQQAAVAGRSYSALLAEMLSSLADRIGFVTNPLLEPRTVKNRGILVITTDKGLCGALNGNLFKVITEQKDSVHYVSIGRQGTQFLGRTRRNLVADFLVSDHVAFSEVRVVVDFMLERYIYGEIDTIEVLYPRFVNTLVQQPTLVPLLPLGDLSDIIDKLRGGTPPEQKAKDDRPVVFEPSMEEVLEGLLTLYIRREVYQYVLDAKASEQSARMVAMKAAKDNASSLLDDLTLEYNKARQAAITQEILELAAASASS